MDSEMTLLHQKIDLLTETVKAQRQRLDALETSPNGNARMLEKLDYLVQQAEAQRRSQEEMNELKRDLLPIGNQMIKLTIDELAEIGSEFQAEDLLYLVKRLLRDTHLLTQMLDQVEAAAGLLDESSRIGKQVFNQSVAALDKLEQQGYFVFARGGWKVIERVVSEFSEEDLNELADHIGMVLDLVKRLTQPEFLTLVDKALNALQTGPARDNTVSMWALMHELSDPQVRKGMDRILNVVKVMADVPAAPSTN
jgi:uncharacterized protein YjgD (DUF1641 family)